MCNGTDFCVSLCRRFWPSVIVYCRARMSGFPQKWFLLIHFSFPALGVDPAKPLIRNRASGRLDPGDADVVQILHATARYGDLKRMGHVDFCLNGGHVQPICMNVSSESRRFFSITISFCYFVGFSFLIRPTDRLCRPRVVISFSANLYTHAYNSWTVRLYLFDSRLRVGIFYIKRWNAKITEIAFGSST